MVYDSAVFSFFDGEFRERRTMFMYIYKPRPVPSMGQQPLPATGMYEHKAIWMLCTAAYRTSYVLGSSRNCCLASVVFTVVLITRFRGCCTRNPIKKV